jgi:DNA-binding transcriptional ArsR family regulator
MMHRVGLTEQGEEIANELSQRQDVDECEFYPEGQFKPNTPGVWTLADDILMMLDGPTTVFAKTTLYRDQLSSVIEAMSAFGHARALIARTFRSLCRLNLVDCVHNEMTTLEDAGDVLAALAEPVRLQIIKATLTEPQGAADIRRLTGKPAPSVYYHIGKLQDIGAVYSLGHGHGYVTDAEYVTDIIRALLDLLSTGGDDGDTSTDQSD